MPAAKPFLSTVGKGRTELETLAEGMGIEKTELQASKEAQISQSAGYGHALGYKPTPIRAAKSQPLDADMLERTALGVSKPEQGQQKAGRPQCSCHSRCRVRRGNCEEGVGDIGAQGRDDS